MKAHLSRGLGVAAQSEGLEIRTFDEGAGRSPFSEPVASFVSPCWGEGRPAVALMAAGGEEDMIERRGNKKKERPIHHLWYPRQHKASQLCQAF